MSDPTLNEQCEKWLIGALLADPTLIGEARDLNPLDLQADVLRIIFRSILAVDTEDGTPDLVAVARRLESDGSLADIGGPLALTALANDAPYVAHIGEWCVGIRRAALRRLFQSEAVVISRMANDPCVDEATILARLHRAATNIDCGNSRNIFQTYTMAELDAAEFSTEYLVEGILVANQPCVIAAGKKSLKTNIACDLTLSLASGSKFLGEFWTPQAVRVAIMTGESGDSTTQETMRRIARSKPWINLADYSNAICSFDLPRLGQPQTRRELERFITDNGLKVLIIDPAYLCLDLGDDAGNLFTVGKKLRELTDIGHATGSTIIIIHHNKKSVNDPFAIPELESIAWSGFQEWARQWLLIGRRELYNAEQAGSHKLWLNVGGSAGHSGCWAVDIEEGSRSDQCGRRWEVSVQGASSAVAESIEQREQTKASRDEQKNERRIAADAEKLLKVYRKLPQGETEKRVRETAGMNPARFAVVNQRLLDEGKVEFVPDAIEKNGRTYDGYRIANGTDRNSPELTGTNCTVPVMSRGTELSPDKGSSSSALTDTNSSHCGGDCESVPVNHDLASELFPVGAA